MFKKCYNCFGWGNYKVADADFNPLYVYHIGYTTFKFATFLLTWN